MENFEYLSLEQEKYLCKLHRLNAYSLLKLEKAKEVELGIADANGDSELIDDIENQLDWIRIELTIRAKLS